MNDPYLYHDCDVLKNKQGIKDEKKLRRFEIDISCNAIITIDAATWRYAIIASLINDTPIASIFVNSSAFLIGLRAWQSEHLFRQSHSQPHFANVHVLYARHCK